MEITEKAHPCDPAGTGLCFQTQEKQEELVISGETSSFFRWSLEMRTSGIRTKESKPPGNSQPRLRGFGQKGINPRHFKKQANLLNLRSILFSKHQ